MKPAPPVSPEVAVNRPPHPLVKRLFRMAEREGVIPAHLARRTGVNPKNHWDWKNGHRMPRLDLFCYTAEALGYELVIRKKKK